MSIRAAEVEVQNLTLGRACGWYVLEIPDGNTNVSAISSALDHAADHVGQPTFINIKTEIGRGTSIAGTCKAHHAAFGHDNVKQCKRLWGYDPEETHVVPDDVRQYWSEVPKKGERTHREWQDLLGEYALQYPKLAKSFRQLADGTLDQGWRQDLLSLKAPEKDTPIRQSSAAVFDALWKTLPFFGGSADLSEPNNVLREPKVAFGPKDNVSHQSYEGRYVHYGTREHAMAAISNGIAAYSSRDEDESRGQSLIPITATFSMFQLYAAPAIRMGALMSLQIIHIGTHDSIAEGACGPTHQVSQNLIFPKRQNANGSQPVELINLWRSMPNLLHIRPCDAEEAIGAWIMAIDHKGPSVLGLNRGAVPLQKGTDRIKMQRGAYVIVEDDDAKVTLVSTGSEVSQCVEAAKVLREGGIRARIVSMPSMRRFEQQDQEYILSVLPLDGRPVVSVEAMSMHGWARWYVGGLFSCLETSLTLS